MRLILISLAIIIASCNCPKNKCNKENTDTTQCCKSKKSEYEHLVMATLWYQQSAEMKALYHQCYNWATRLLDENLEKSKSNLKKAVVVDIDETLLDNSPFEVKCIEEGKGYSSESWKNWTDKSIAKALPGALEFCNYAKSKNVEIFYISNRKINEVETTSKNLIDLGFPYVDDKHIIFRTEDNSKKTRREVVSKDYEIILLIGDNLTDFSEIFEHRDSSLGFKLVEENKADFGSKFIMLPNPMYGEWESAIYNNDNKIPDSQKDSLRKSYLKSY